MVEEIFKNSVEYFKVFTPPLLALAFIAAIIWAIAMLIALIMLGLEELADRMSKDGSEEECEKLKIETCGLEEALEDGKKR